MKKKGIKLFSLLISTMVFICNISFVKAEETSAYAYSDSATSNGVTLKVEWNEPVLGEPTTFHVSATGGSGIYKFNMEAPSYTNPDELAYESVADPSRGEWTKYTSECESQDYTFTMMATGTYNFRFHVMDTKAGVTYLRTNTYIQVSSPNYPSVNSIVQNAVAKCNSETNGSDYSKALWLHDWLLEQLDYDNSLKWSSAESALTRSSGTCQAYERAYAKLLSAAGIENAETRDTYDGHTWNAMKLDGKWYQVDCTWDDSSENYYNFNRTHLYFALSDELMAIAHQGHNKIYTVGGYATPSNSLEHNYFVQNGDAQQWVESYRNRIQENLNNKNTEFSIQADNSTYPPSIYGIQNGIIAYVMNQNEWFVNGKKVELAAKTNDKQFDFVVTYPVECTNHDWDEGVITTEPTCTTKGVKTFTCNNCKTTKTEEVKALGHAYSKDWTIDKKATCTEEGSKSHHCTRCDSKKDTTSISKKEHEWDNGTVTKESTNKETGIKTFKCKNCNDTKTEVIPVKRDESNVDSEAPVIDVSSVKLSTKSATTGDTVKISIKITDNVDVDRAVIQLINYDTGKIIGWTNLTYNETTGLYEYSLEITDDISNGHWYIDNIQAYDAANNASMESFKRNEYGFIVKDTKADSESPVIDVNSIDFNTKSATTGDTVKISIKITDNVEVGRAVIQLINYDTGKIIGWTNLTYNEATELYEYSLEITDDIPNGHWYIDNIQAYDAANNASMESFKRNEYGFIVKDTKADSESPVIDVNSIDFNTKSATTGDTVKISIKITDNVEVGRAVIQLINYDTGKIIGWTNLTYNEATELYEYSLEITDDIPNGHWYIDNIQAYDAANNASMESFKRNEYGFIVTRNNVDVHKWNNGVILQQPTCTKKGETIFECSLCHETKTEELKALGHDYSKEWTIDKKATCTESGSKSHHCARCDSKTDVTVIPKTSHNWNDGVITTAPTCTKDGVKTYTCKDCKVTKTEVVKALGHDYSSDWTIDKKATCTESGSKSHHCARCDSKTDVTVIPKTSHNWNDGVITTKATCTKDGVKTYTCRDCKTTKTEVIKALGHDYFSSWTIDKKATCTESGSKSHHCTRCDSKSDVTVIPKTSHNFDNGVITTSPTCTKDGVKTYTCKDCKTTKTEVLKALGHDYSKEWTIDKKATCTESGSKSHHCTRCDSKSDVTVIPKTSHNFDNGVITTSPTCTKDGVKTYTCKDCKTTKTEVLKALGHDYSKDWTIDKKATCTESGSKSHHCTRCDSKSDVTVIPVLSHNYDDGVITTKATCTKDGVKTYTCKDCKTTKTEVIKALGHDYSNEWTIDKKATCLEEGSKSHHCTRCDSKSDVTVIPKLSHNYDNGVITTEPTCTKDGVKTYTCKDCKTTKTEVLKALGHDYSKDWTIDKKATCLEEGSKSHHCTRCDSKSDVTVISKLSHDWILTSTVNPTRDHEGKKVYTCNLCKETKKESIPKLVGKWVSNSVGKWYEYSDGTYENSGFKKIESETYYFTSNGYAKTGWLSVNNNWYFFKNSGCMITSNWVGSYYMDSDGKMKTNSFTPDGYYCGADGVYVRNAWIKYDGNYYYMNANGLMTKNAWAGSYYLGSDGVMKTNAFTPDGYYVGSDGAYYRNRWIKYENKYYYTNGAGLIVKNAWIGAYYLGSDGVMMINSFTPDGYYVGADGAYLRNQKIEVDGKEYYLNAAGKVAKNQWVGDYFIDVNGNVVRNHWVGNYWCGADGRYVKSSWVDDGRYYVGSNGVYVINQWIGDYYLNGVGLVTKNAWVGNYWCGSDGKYVKSSWVDNNQYYVGANGVYVPGRWVAYGSRWCYYAGNVYAKDITLNINGIAYTFDCNGYMK